MHMTIKISSKTKKTGLLPSVQEMSGVDLSICYQCKKCTSGCPVAKMSKFPPSEIIRRLHLGAGEELLDIDFIWLCLSCGTCYARCPMKIDFASVVDTLKQLAVAKGKAKPEGNVPLFNDAFLQTVKQYGRSYDLGMIMAYKLGTGKLMNDAEKFPEMLRKGKMAMLPASGADKKQVRRIFDKTKQAGGKH
jgi:heterodisulfide reductase subunit C2